MAPRKYSLAAIASLLRKKKPVAKDKILVLGAGEPVGEAVLATIVQKHAKDTSIVAAVSTRRESTNLMRRHPSIRTTIGNVESPAFLETAAQMADIVINTHASPSTSAATAAAHLVHVLSYNARPHTFYIHTSSVAVLHTPPSDPAAPRNETAAIAAATTAAVKKAREEAQPPKQKKETQVSVHRVWNDVADIDEICARPAGSGYARVDAAVRDAVRAAEKRSAKRRKGGQRVRLAIVAPGIVYGSAASASLSSSSSAAGSRSPREILENVGGRVEKEVGVVHVDDLVQLYLRLVEKALLGPAGKTDVEEKEKERPWEAREWAWEECWGLHAFYFAVAEYMSIGELGSARRKSSRVIGQDDCCERQESGRLAEEKDSDAVLEARCFSERARWILGWVLHEGHTFQLQT
ncbi:uncharacterized protein IWZ02DRAFT_229056 [Phyllosticta citriasiana]|uniref:uncharacterized protein n=1 Tax=Phyllosticta citriasiana TaxID=595635 RepID=UPI0030FDCD87